MSRVEDYEIIRQLKGGSIGKAFLTKLKKTGVLYVLKRLEYFMSDDKKHVDALVAQIQHLESRYTMKLICTFADRMDLCLIFEFCEFGDIYKGIVGIQELSEEEQQNRVWEILAQIARSLDFLHSQNIIHQNIKPSNIFLMEDGSVKLDGIGLTDESTNKYYQIMIKSNIYQAPEVQLNKKMDQSSNVFSLGCIIHEALTGQHPFFAPTKQEMIEKIRKGQFTELPDWIEPEMKDLVLAMMNQNPDKRPTIKRIIEMKKIKSLISHFIENEQIRELTIEKLKRMKDEVQTVENDKKSSVCLITKVSEGLKTVRYIRTGNEIQINGKIYELIKEVTENCASIISRVIQSEEDVELAFQHNLIQVLIDLLRCTPLDDITPSMTKAFEIISDQGSSVQTHRLFEMSTIHSLVQIIRIKDKDILLNILKTFIHIIKNGWSQIKTSQSQYAQQQFNLQQLLQPNSHPYLVQLEKDAIIRIIIEDLLANESTYLWCKYKICEILDILYPEGAQLPSDLQPQIINQLYSPMKQKHEIEPYALQSLSYLAINYGNHGAIIAGGGVNIASEYIMKNSKSERINSSIAYISLKFLHNLFLFGSKNTQQQILNSINAKQLNNLINNKSFTQKEKAMKLLSAFSDPEGMRQLLQIRKIIEIKNKNEQIELIKAGLMTLLIENLNQTVEQQECEGKRIIIIKIINLLTFDNIEAKQIILEETNFVDGYIHFINILPFNKVFIELFDVLWELSVFQPKDQKYTLFSKAIIQTLMRILELKDYFIRLKVCVIILNVINSGLIDIKEGENHPFLKPLNDDKKIEKLFQMMKDKQYENIHRQIAHILAYLFKAALLPIEISKIVIKQLKTDEDFEGLAFLAENIGHHDIILSKDFEKKIFENQSKTYEAVKLTLTLLHIGSDENKKKISISVYQNVENLADDEYVNEFGNKQIIKWKQDLKEEIILKAKEILLIINDIFGEKIKILQSSQSIQQSSKQTSLSSFKSFITNTFSSFITGSTKQVQTVYIDDRKEKEKQYIVQQMQEKEQIKEKENEQNQDQESEWTKDKVKQQEESLEIENDDQSKKMNENAQDDQKENN